jgi:hypothetical protein
MIWKANRADISFDIMEMHKAQMPDHTRSAPEQHKAGCKQPGTGVHTNKTGGFHQAN